MQRFELAYKVLGVDKFGGTTIMLIGLQNPIRPVDWVGSSYKDFRCFPDLVQDVMGFALLEVRA
jgi:hypothetical protein